MTLGPIGLGLRLDPGARARLGLGLELGLELELELWLEVELSDTGIFWHWCSGNVVEIPLELFSS